MIPSSSILLNASILRDLDLIHYSQYISSFLSGSVRGSFPAMQIWENMWKPHCSLNLLYWKVSNINQNGEKSTTNSHLPNTHLQYFSVFFQIQYFRHILTAYPPTFGSALPPLPEVLGPPSPWAFWTFFSKTWVAFRFLFPCRNTLAFCSLRFATVVFTFLGALLGSSCCISSCDLCATLKFQFPCTDHAPSDIWDVKCAPPGALFLDLFYGQICHISWQPSTFS